MDGATWAAWVGVVVAAAIGGDGIRRARNADKRAGTAGEHASAALELARRAEERADRVEQMASEHRDIEFRRNESVEAGVLSFVNVGADSAYDVELLVTTSHGTQPPVTQPEVGSRQAIGYHLTTAARDAARAEHRQDRTFRPGRIMSANVQVRLRWRSQAGAPGRLALDDVAVPIQ